MRSHEQNGGLRSHHFLMIPHAALPHIIPMVHLADKLVQHGVRCTVLSYDFLLEKIPREDLRDGVHLLGLPQDLTGYSKPENVFYPPIVNSEALSFVANVYIDRLMQEQGPGKDGSPLYTCLISDVLLPWTVEAAARLNVPRYLLSPGSAFAFLMLHYAPLSNDADDIKRIIHFPNMFPNGVSCNIFSVPPQFAIYIRKSILNAAGMFGNSFYELETCAIDELRRMGKKVYAVGPLESAVRVTKSFVGDSNLNFVSVNDECLHWLNEQAEKSVVYVNFGSTGFIRFNLKMVHELALGLEASGAKFLWVLRPPPTLSSDELYQLLPSGFEERVKDRGLISRGWAPQLKILEHPSTAAFVMQAGWNSIMESVARGVPMISWPTYADQPVNAKCAAEISKVGIQLPQGNVHRNAVETAIRAIMCSEEGKVLKENAQRMKLAAARATNPGGSSFQNLQDFITDL
ncbi:hypothetical protein Mapa_011719 [Marchantia paleacea]|nr:hypothetical protein Mapa_011719 [Marchantia paleacea]